jgi:hypothetical protein
MEAPSIRYILSRAVFLIVAVIAILSGVSFYKKKQRETAVISQLKSIASDSSYFQQFYAEDAKKTLVKGIGLIAEANQLGIPPEKSINRSIGIVDKTMFDDLKEEEPDAKAQIVRASLSANYENFNKLGYKADFQTLSSMREGALPPIPSGPEAGKTPVIATIIDPELSPGIDRVLANLEIRPPQVDKRPPSDVEIAAAKRLASALAEAHIIEAPVRDKIVQKLTPAAK